MTDPVCIAGADPACRRAENAQRRETLWFDAGELQRNRSAIFRTDQVTDRDRQRVKEACDIGGNFRRSPFVFRWLARAAKAWQIETHDAIGAREQRYPWNPGT